MKLKYDQEIDFRQERDFGAKIGATFEFLGAHFRPLLKCLTYFVLPPALLMGIGLGLFTNGIWNQMVPLMGQGRQQGGAPGFHWGTNTMGGVGLMMLGALFSFLLVASTVYAYVAVRLRLPAGEVVTPRLVWEHLRPRLGRVLLAYLLLAGLGSVALGLSSALVALLHPGLIALLIFPGIYLVICLSLYFPILWMEDCGVLAALRRSFYLIGGKWWSTLGLQLVVGMIQGIMSTLFTIPQYAVLMGKMLHLPGLDSDALGIVTQCIYAVGSVFLYSISQVSILFQYFNLVERKEGLGLRYLIDSLGQRPAPQAVNSAYQADEEGEY